MSYTIALAQIDSTVGNIEKNIEKHLYYIERAIEQKANIIVFPELSLTGYSLRDITYEVAINPHIEKKYFQQLKKISKSITIIVGGVEEGENYALYNSAFVFEKGEYAFSHRKIYLPTYGMFEEMRYFHAGKNIQSFNSQYGKLGILVCEDAWHLSLPYILAHDGAEIFITITASPTRITGNTPTLSNNIINTEHHKTYSRLLSSYFVFCNRVGIEDGVNFWGGSKIINPFGEIIAEAKLFEEDLIIGKIDSTTIRQARRDSRHFLDDNPEFTIQQLQNTISKK